MNPYHQCNVTCNSQYLEQPKCPLVDEWIKQLWYIYTIGYYMAIKNEDNFTLCDSMDEPGEHYTK